jgi:hypothetical protein
MNKNIFDIIFEITRDAFHNFTYFIKSNLIVFANILNLLVPYAMYFIGQHVAFGKNNFVISCEILIPLGLAILIYYLRSAANKIGKGMTIPIPDKRFTQVDEDGEVSVENKRLQELLLYVADVEDWLERKGML